ncbi:MAG TPA: 5'-3' exonuclease H3TH domain-containing protein [Solirubrobacteraceae bacterium]|nr:5'-3' exonuclease H3TH domain-containing protein [Solirubrobacteraceae bacterium]
MPERAPLLVADIPWLLYRSYFALPSSITDGEGRPVNALLGTVNALLAVLVERPARAVVACFGAEQASYRVELYPPYHAHRDPMPPELAAQWTRAAALLASLAWVVCDAGELEADDAIYSHARAEAERGGRALLLTGDRDLFAAVDDRVAIVELAKGGVAGEVGPAQVRERYGVDPAQVADFIALRGDPSDGLPGAPGVGAKTAAELLSRYGSLEGVLVAAGASGVNSDRGADGAGSAARAVRAAHEMRPRIAAALRDHADQLRAFQEIATLQRISVDPVPDRPTDFAAGASAARSMGMNRLAARLTQLESSR